MCFSPKKVFFLNRETLNAAGFTLFELLIVLVIIGLVSVLVLPKVGGNLDGLKLKVETRKVAAALRSARSRAVSENMTVTVKVNNQEKTLTAETNSYSLEADYPWIKSFPFEEEEKVVLYQLNLDDLVAITIHYQETEAPKEENGISFYPSGGSTGGDVVLKTDTEKEYRIAIDDISGKVKVLYDDENGAG